MKKLSAIIRYECVTSIKYVGIFYAILYTAVLIALAITYIAEGSFDNPPINGIEFNSIIYLAVIGALGYKEDFKMLIQNGFTRTYICIGTLSMFIFISLIMSLVDTITGNLLHIISNNYHSQFQSLYGFDHSVIMNWIWILFIYIVISCSTYLAVLIQNKVGRKLFIIGGIMLGLILFLIFPALLQFVIPETITQGLMDFAFKALGFMSDGTINFLYPIVILIIMAGVLNVCSFFVIRKTEIKA